MYTIVRKNKKGLTLIELIVVTAILLIIAAIAIPSIVNIKSNAKRDVFLVNQEELEKKYEAHLALHEVGHSDVLFADFLHDNDSEVCLDDGEFRYVDGEVKCSIHSDEENDEEENEGGVPFL
ncbi:prepilin-type N-terminal cleavage/methylation domain-containing protein [Cytobacillus gottheilii]|uniref:prepilin-type N-terminal cleavage/methylation domain-containing protein n=1 Tax=Cytobacillus gottheilii TaxID=859144 RepID=UPI0009BBB7D6|nr:prepilin-type N-terminal cleavage/methylation domain-containing protein [Cytobacillus gottheilii]